MYKFLKGIYDFTADSVKNSFGGQVLQGVGQSIVNTTKGLENLVNGLMENPLETIGEFGNYLKSKKFWIQASVAGVTLVLGGFAALGAGPTLGLANVSFNTSGETYDVNTEFNGDLVSQAIKIKLLKEDGTTKK